MPEPKLNKGVTNVLAFDRIGFQNGRLRLGKTTIADLRVKDTLTATNLVGNIANEDVIKGTDQKTSRYYLKEYFYQLPALNGNLTNSVTKDWANLANGAEDAQDVTVTGAALGDYALASMSIDVTDLTITASVTAADTVTVILTNNTGGAIDLGSGTLSVMVIPAGGRVLTNSNFEVLGTNMTTALVTRPTISSGIKLTTAGADQDQAILIPHLDTGASPWTGILWGTEDELIYEAVIRTSAAIDNQKIWTGLKLTSDQLPETDANQAYFYYATDGTNGQLLADHAKLYFIYSVAGTDYLTNLGIDVAANTNYHLKIVIDSERKVSILVNGTKYGLSTTAQATDLAGATSATGTVVSDKNQKSVALTNDINLIPYVGIEAGDGNAASLDVVCCAISRKIESPL